MQRKRRGFGFLLLMLLIVLGIWLNRRPTPEKERAAVVSEIEEMLRVPASIARQEGTAAAILVDTSGSMKETVPDNDGQPKPKIDIARRATSNLLRRFSDHARKNPDHPLLVGVYEFSSRDDQPDCRALVRPGPLDLEKTEAELGKMIPSGGTPIGDAMIAAKKDLDMTGMTHRHILVVTDGENNRGYSPGVVAGFLAGQPAEDRASIYFVAFDVKADKFNAVKESGGLVLEAANERDLNQTLDFILTGKILAEQPSSTTSK